MSRPIAFLDACVLYPVSLRDILIELAVAETYQAKWSSVVEHEVIKNVETNNPHTRGKLGRTFELMRKAVPDYSAESTEQIADKVATSKTDKKDIKILSAAIAGGCNQLVTFNSRDFDSEFANQYKLEVVLPDYFLSSLITDNPDASREAFCRVIARHKNPKITSSEYLQALAKLNLKKTSNLLSEKD